MSLIIAQGLLGGQVVTQGWSAPVAPNLITQGLGGPVLLQGLSGVTHLVVWPSGGVALGSSGLGVRQNASATASGGLAIAGTALPVHAASVSCGGGSALAGAAAAHTAHAVAAGGGMALGGVDNQGSLAYHIYINSGTGDPISYASAVAMVTRPAWTSGTLTAPGSYKLGVRAFNPSTGLEEQNIDAVVELVLDAGGNDITQVPPAPLGLRAFSTAGGIVRAEWSCPCGIPLRQPTGFHVYVGTGGLPEYTTAVATVPWSSGRFGCFTANLTGLTAGQRYALAVRAFNGVGEESNTTVLTILADGTPPALVDALQAVATSQE